MAALMVSRRAFRQISSALSRCYSATAQPVQKPERPSTPKDVDEPSQELVIDPLKHPDYFNINELLSIEEMFKKRVHLGHAKRVRNRFMTNYLYGTRMGMDIIDLDVTKPLLRHSLNFTAHVAYRGGVIMFVTRRAEFIASVEKTALDLNEYAHCRYWKSGTFTNRESTYYKLPSLVIFLQTQNFGFKPHRAIAESSKFMIPTTGLVDTNCDPRMLSYPVPANDDTPSSVLHMLSLYKTAVERGKEARSMALNIMAENEKIELEQGKAAREKKSTK